MVSSILLPDAAEPTAKSFVTFDANCSGLVSRAHASSSQYFEKTYPYRISETFGGYVSLVVEILAVIPDMQVSFTTPLAEAAVVH